MVSELQGILSRGAVGEKYPNIQENEHIFEVLTPLEWQILAKMSPYLDKLQPSSRFEFSGPDGGGPLFPTTSPYSPALKQHYIKDMQP